MKKLITLVLALVCVLGLVGCGKTENIIFPFSASDVETVESYYDDGGSEIQKKRQQTKQPLIIFTLIFPSCL